MNTLEKLFVWISATVCVVVIGGALSISYVHHTVAAMLPSNMFEPKTPVAFPEFYQMVEGHNGRAYSANHLIGKTSFLNLIDCEAAVAQSPNPDSYYCLRYESAKTIPHAFPEPQEEPRPDHAGRDNEL